MVQKGIGKSEERKMRERRGRKKRKEQANFFFLSVLKGKEVVFFSYVFCFLEKERCRVLKEGSVSKPLKE